MPFERCKQFVIAVAMNVLSNVYRLDNFVRLVK